MSMVNIYGGGAGTVTRCPTPPEGNTYLVDYMKRFTTIMKRLIVDYDKDTAIKRIELIKVQILNDLGGDINILK